MNSKNKHSIDDTSSIDDFLFDLAKKDYTPIPEDIHNNIIKTIIFLGFITFFILCHLVIRLILLHPHHLFL